MSRTIFAYAPAVILWLGTAYTLRPFWRDPRNPGHRNLWLTFVFLAAAITVLLPPVYLGIDHVTTIANLSRLLSNGLTLLACWALQAFLSHVSGAARNNRGEVRRNGWLLVGALIIMTALFLTAPVPVESLDFIQRYGDASHILEYRLVYLLYLGLSQVTLTRLAWRYAQVAESPSLRLGLRIWSFTGAIALAYVANDGLYLIFRRLGLAYPIHNPAALDQVLVALALSIGAVGVTMPSWGPRVGIPRLYRWMNDYRSLRRLYPLWFDLCQSNPDIALIPPPGVLGDVLDVRDVGFRLYRRTVEIRDGWLALRPYFSAEVRDLAEQLSRERHLDEREAKAVTDASVLAAALWARAKGQTTRDRSVTWSSSGGQSLEEEVATLERVARNYVHSPIVRQVRRRLDARSAPPAAGLSGLAGER